MIQVNSEVGKKAIEGPPCQLLERTAITREARVKVSNSESDSFPSSPQRVGSERLAARGYGRGPKESGDQVTEPGHLGCHPLSPNPKDSPECPRRVRRIRHTARRAESPTCWHAPPS